MDETVAAFLERVPDEYVVVDPSAVEGEVTAAGDGEPDAASDAAARSDAADAAPDPATERARELLGGGPETTGPRELHLLTPAVPDALVDPLKLAVLGEETEVDVVATGAAADVVERGPIAAAKPMLAGRSDVSIGVHDGDAPFAVLLRPDVVGFALVDGDGEVEAVLESDGEAARSWARDVFDVYGAEAEPLV